MKHEMQPYIVYVKLDDANRITAVNSSAFLTDLTEWMEIDSGYGDKYHHAQGNYFSKPIMDERGIYRYRLVLGVPQERTQEEMDTDYVPLEEKPTLESRVTIVEGKSLELEETLDMILSGVVEDE